MFITITDIAKGKPFTLDSRLEGNELRIGIHRIDMWVGYYNIYENQTCRWAKNGQPSQDFTVEAGLYNFEELVKQLAVVEGLTITADKTKGLAEVSVPPRFQLWLTEPIKYLLGIDETDWLTGVYVGDCVVEFTPKRLLIYLKQLSTTGNYHNNNQRLVPSQLLCSIPLSAEPIGSFHTIKFENPQFRQLQNNVHEIDLDINLEWGNGVRHKLDNHGQPIDILMEIK